MRWSILAVLLLRKTGTHRRVRMEDLLAYKRQRDRDRMASLDDLSQLSQDFVGYEELATDARSSTRSRKS